MAVLFNVVLPVFLIIGAVALAQTRLRLNVRTLSRAAFYLFAPALVFDSLTTSTASGLEFAQITATVLLTTAALWLLGVILGRLLRLKGPILATFLVAILIMNAGNYGLSVNLFAFDEPGLARASLYFPISTVLAASLGVYLSARGRTSVGLALRRMIGIPLVYAVALGLVFTLTNLTVPEPLQRAIHVLGQASIPTMLAVLGIRLLETFQDRQQALHLPALGAVIVLRLIVSPALAWVFAGLVGLSSLTHNVTVVESAMPSAVMTIILATEFESDPPFAALCVLVTTLVSLPTITLLLNWLI